MFIEQKQQTKYSVDARPHFYSEGFKVFQGESESYCSSYSV